MSDRPTILLADDHRILTDALVAALREHFDVAGTFSNGRDLLRVMENQSADVVVLDISMPELNGIETAKRLHAKLPTLPIVFLTMHGERPYVEEALRAGAKGYVLKRQAASDLVEAIRSVLAGKRYISRLSWRPDEPVQGDGDLLTPRQREVLQLVAEGKSMKEMAGILNISTKTVEFHKKALMDRLGLRTTAELTRWAMEHRIT
jgi:DNA-binding NarL/FixJ family response regulator